AAQAPDAPLDRLRDLAQMLEDELLDVPLVPRLRPAALVVPPGNVVGLVGDLDESAVAQPVDLPALAADVRDERPVAADMRGERCEVELAPDTGGVADRGRQRQRAPEVVGTGGEDRDAAGALAV